MKYIVMIVLLSNNFLLPADCTRADRAHNDTNVVRCSYTQEDIYNCYSNKTHCYECEQRRQECFYCKCSISEHTKCEIPEKCSRNTCVKKGPFDDEIIGKRREKNKRRK